MLPGNDHHGGMTARRRHWLGGTLGTVALVAAVTGVIALLETHLAVEGLAVLYLPAVLLIAIEWGVPFAVLASVASAVILALFLSPDGSVFATDWTDLLALAVYLVTALVVGQLAAGLRRHAHEAAQLAAEQAALRRVATLVAQGAAATDVFEAVTREVGLLCDADLARMERYETDGTVSGVAAWSRTGGELAVGTRFALVGVSVAALVLEAKSPVRIDSFSHAHGPIADEARSLGIRSSVGCPIEVSGELWGVIAASLKDDLPFPADTESRIGEFTRLVAIAIANAHASTEIAASRARVVAAADHTRRRIERDLHDGAQQRLVSLMLQLRGLAAAVPPTFHEVQEGLAAIGSGLENVLEELREISRGIHPAILSRGGLTPALRALARRSAVPVELDLSVKERLPDRVEVAAYYIVSEALANAAKHADASVARVAIHTSSGSLRLSIRDDGIGGADPARGSGLIGLKDRVEAVGGTLRVESPTGVGTSLFVDLPLSVG
jgi:signal transduction histidine kinase